MEFKKPHRYKQGQSKNTPKQRVNSSYENVTSPATATHSKNSTNSKTINIKISFDSLSKTALFARIRRLNLTKRTVVVSTGIFILVSCLVAGAFIYHHSTTRNSADITNPNEVVKNLDYGTVLPDNKSIDELGGWRRVSPAKSDPVFAYSDKIGTATITVSQQPLPDSFKGNVDSQVAEVAKKFSATTKIDADHTKVYIGTSTKGPQSVIFTKNNLLILIKSQVKIDDKDWASYAKSLR